VEAIITNLEQAIRGLLRIRVALGARYLLVSCPPAALGAVASYLPAVRASRLSPVDALRFE
jgi:ABC-type lipoprotein release transport system permease subunit